ncbi:MAG: Glycosyltransferase AglE [Methanocella sp. PtaU1.Bin125]|nr:MAG: Glycosyltransferase AglE [Methanocella sp. PtaU1.Bin125]
MPLVSVIMTSYNYGRYIAQAIESVLFQTFTDFELIVIDDGSDDDSREIIERYGRRDPRVKSVFHRSNEGAAYTYNEGIALSRGKFVAFLDSDDLWAGDKLEKQLDILKNNENLVVWSEGEIIDKNGAPTGKTFTSLHKATGRRKTGRIFDELVKGNFIFVSSTIFKKDNLQGVLFGSGVNHMIDFPVYLDLSRRHDFHFIEEPLAKYRIHGGNITLKDPEAWNSDALLINGYILSKYGAELDNRMISKLMCYSGMSYSKEGNYRRSFECLCAGIRARPLNAYYLLVLPISVTKFRLRRSLANWRATHQPTADAS